MTAQIRAFKNRKRAAQDDMDCLVALTKLQRIVPNVNESEVRGFCLYFLRLRIKTI